MFSDIIISARKINSRLKKVEHTPQNLVGWASGTDFPNNRGEYPAVKLPETTTWKKFYHIDRGIDYQYDKTYAGWLSVQTHELVGQMVNNFNYIQIIEDYSVVITRILIGLKSFDTMLHIESEKRLNIMYSNNNGEGTLLTISGKDLVQRNSSFYTYSQYGYFPFVDSPELFLIGTDFILSNYYVTFSIQYKLIG